LGLLRPTNHVVAASLTGCHVAKHHCIGLGRLHFYSNSTFLEPKESKVAQPGYCNSSQLTAGFDGIKEKEQEVCSHRDKHARQSLAEPFPPKGSDDPMNGLLV
jgi:hypothetical protein